MKRLKLSFLFFFTVVGICWPTLPQGMAITFAQKREQLSKSGGSSSVKHELKSIHEALMQKKAQLRSIYGEMGTVIFADVGQDGALGAEQVEIAEGYRQKISTLQKEIRSLEQEWKEIATDEDDDSIDGLWHQPDSTIGQLVIDYSNGDSVFVMPPDIASYKIHLSSRLSVPKAEWSEMLDVILASCGIGIKPLTPFVKQLYFLRLNQSGLGCITDDRKILNDLPPDERIAFVCSPPTGELRRILQFLEKFAPQEQLGVQMVGGHLVLIGQVREVKDLMKVYDFIVSPKRAQEYRIITLQRADSEEVAKILTCIFEGEMARASEGGAPPAPAMLVPQDASFGFRVIPLKFPASSLFFIGKHEQIEKACRIVQDLEVSIGEVQEKTIHWYACRHSEAEELAKVLSQVYSRMMGLTSQGSLKDKIGSASKKDAMSAMQEKIQAREHAEDSLIVNSSPVSLTPEKSTSSEVISENFIVDSKTNSIIMVVENYVYPKLKELLQKLDVPKRMVQIDVLLFEKRVSDSSSMGLSRLRMGDAASHKSREGLMWTDVMHESAKKRQKHHKKDSKDNKQGMSGILEFFISRGKSGIFPAYDLAYQFLLTQEDIQINANPSVTTVNQTPAKIAVVDQISINTGAVEFDRDHFKDSYSRAEYGITIQITPTVHSKIDEENVDEPKFVTLMTDIIFDSTSSDRHERPDVTRRNIKNEVRVQDGETVILGGLRRKLSNGQQQMIPFLGELPGVGKLFSMSTLSDSNTEMFVFLTPRILPDDHERWKEVRRQELAKRPGDTPEFLDEVLEARRSKKEMLMSKSLRMLFGKPDISI
jgi:general secretion pathway protein D